MGCLLIYTLLARTALAVALDAILQNRFLLAL
jgi:hypothetical protein